MAEKGTLWMALFDDLDAAVRGIEELRELGVRDEDMEILSGVPFDHAVLGRPKVKELMGRISLTGALVGLVTALLLVFGTVYLYPIRVGGHPYFTLPPKLIIMYEFTMLGIIISTFLGAVVWQSALPSFKPKPYDPSISDGRIGIVYRVADNLREQAREALAVLGAEIKEAEWRPL